MNEGNCDVIAYLPTSSTCDVWGSAMTTDSAGASLSDLPESGTRTLQFGADHECLKLYYADGGDLEIVKLTLNGEDVLHCMTAPSRWDGWGCGADGVAAQGRHVARGHGVRHVVARPVARRVVRRRHRGDAGDAQHGSHADNLTPSRRKCGAAP